MDGGGGRTQAEGGLLKEREEQLRDKVEDGDE